MKPLAFGHASCGTLQLDETTCGTPLAQLGALYYTMDAAGAMATDKEGLEEASMVADAAITAFAFNLQSIGELLFHADVDNVSSGALNDLGNLVRTLGRNIITLSNMKAGFDDELIRLARQAKKGGK